MIPVSENIYIFGAHTRAQNLYAYFKALFPECKVEGFLYDNDEPNPPNLYGTEVIHIDQIEELSERAKIWVAVKSVYFEDVTDRISRRFSNEVVFVTPEIDNELRNRYADIIFGQKGITFTKIYDMAGKRDNARSELPVIYMAKSIYDQQTSEHTYPSYIVPVQAGAALTDKRITAISDDTGDNISSKNRQYCELTVLYWMWRNAEDPWVGLCHYRRHFVLSDDEAAWIPQSGVDVILPVPSICQPSVGANYRKRHDKKDWDHLLDFLKQSYPDFYDLAVSLWETQEYGNLYYTCNMFIMKKTALNEYCSWLFPILSEMEWFGGQKEDAYQNRYLGFLAERLLTLYFIYHKDKYKIAYADKIFIPNKK